jgi:aspartate aminotransferase-like enzyme
MEDRDMDVALAGSRKVAGPPPGLVILLASVVVVPRALAR